MRRTADNLDETPHDRISQLNRMSAILSRHVPYRDIRKYQQAAARMLAKRDPPGLAVICADYRRLEMIPEAEA